MILQQTRLCATRTEHKRDPLYAVYAERVINREGRFMGVHVTCAGRRARIWESDKAGSGV